MQLNNSVKEIIEKKNNNNDNNELEKNLIEKIYTYDKIKDILNSEDKNKILFLYKDYILYLVFLRMEIKIKKKETKEFIFKLIDKIIQLYDNDININNINEANIIKDKEKIRTIFSKIILFLEKNIEFISKIILIFIEFIDIIPNVENFFKNLKNEKNSAVFIDNIFYSFIDAINNSIFLESKIEIPKDKSKLSYYFNNKMIYIELIKKN